MSSLFHNNRLISLNPATLETVGEVGTISPGHVEDVVASARQGFYMWRKYPLAQRANILKQAQQILLERAGAMAELITLEMGRPIAESLAMEVEAGIDLIGYYARHAHQFLGERRLPLHHIFFARRGSRIHFQPLGVMGVITPWNWSLLIPLGGIVPALLAGNSVVFKPSELTPLVGQKIQECFLDAGVPESVFKVIHGDSHVGAALAKSGVDKLFFTGSTSVGQKILAGTAGSLKPVILEMGGSDPAIVCEDADLEIAGSGIVWGAFNNCGQNCNSIERVFVHKHHYETFLKRIIEKTGRLRIGNGLLPESDIGPLASKAQFEKIEKVIHKAQKAGAELRFGGRPSDHGGYFFEPAILTAEQPLESFYNEEMFGPVMIVTPVQNDEEAVRFANQSAFGLAGSVWTRSRKRGMQIARQLEAGSVMVNDAIVSFGITEAGWTGIKQSGIGWVHGEKGLDEMVNIQYLNFNPQYKMQNIWWFPYGTALIEAMKLGMDFLFHRSLWRKFKTLPGLMVRFAPYLLLNARRKDKY